MGGGAYNFCYSYNPFLLVTKDHMQIFKTVAFLLLGYIWLNLKFIPKYTTVGVEEGVFEFLKKFQSYFFGF